MVVKNWLSRMGETHERAPIVPYHMDDKPHYAEPNTAFGDVQPISGSGVATRGQSGIPIELATQVEWLKQSGLDPVVHERIRLLNLVLEALSQTDLSSLNRMSLHPFYPPKERDTVGLLP